MSEARQASDDRRKPRKWIGKGSKTESSKLEIKKEATIQITISSIKWEGCALGRGRSRPGVQGVTL